MKSQFYITFALLNFTVTFQKFDINTTIYLDVDLMFSLLIFKYLLFIISKLLESSVLYRFIESLSKNWIILWFSNRSLSGSQILKSRKVVWNMNLSTF